MLRYKQSKIHLVIQDFNQTLYYVDLLQFHLLSYDFHALRPYLNLVAGQPENICVRSEGQYYNLLYNYPTVIH